MSARASVFAFVLATLVASACAPEIGDDCKTVLDCSATASRACDRTQPNGYCTVQGCERGTCPEEAVCVQFQLRPDTDRLSQSYCMYQCDSHSDCREDEGYRCLSETTFGARDKSKEAIVLDGSSRKFCAVANRPALPETTPPAGDGDDAGTAGAGDAAQMSPMGG